MKILKILILLLTFQIITYAQNSSGIVQNDSVSENELNEGLKTKIGIIARTYSDSVIVRWAVSKPAVWDLCKEVGFILERASILQDGTYSEFKPVKEGVFKPWTEEEWQKYFLIRPKIKDSTEIDYDAFAYMFGSTNKDQRNVKIETSTGNELQDLKDKKSKYGWQVLFAILSANSSSNAADGLGLRYVDKDVKLGDKYVYKIKLGGKSPVYIVEDGIVEVKVEKYNPNFAKQVITASENDGSININWKANDQLTFYKVERSEDNGKTFKKLTKLPMLTMKSMSLANDSSEGYLDTIIVNYKPYIYRVYGTTSFADNVFIGEIKAMGRDRTPPGQPFVPQPIQVNDNEIKIKWEMGDNPAKDLKGFYIGRDTSASGEFKYITNLLPPASREYIDTNFIKGGSNFYLVEAVDTAGNISQSYPVYVALNDTVPPAKPQWIKGSIDSNGIVTLILKPNVEKDLMGYRILRSNSPEHEFSSIIESFGNDSLDYTGITTFKDTVTLETTTPYIYYRATALDNRYNESEFSDIMAVKRPDIIAPIAPVIIDVSVTDKSVTLFFAPSTSEDVKYHVANRRISGEEKWDSLSVLGHADSIFIDKNVKPNIMYEYALYAVDSSGLHSKLSFPISARPYYTGVLPAVNNLKVQYEENKNQPVLNWEYENSNGVYFVIYRTIGNVPSKRYATVKESDSRKFTDVNLPSEKGDYTYSIKVFDNLGGESKMSEKVNINVK